MKRITINFLFSLAITALLSMQAQAAEMVDLPDSCEDKGMNIIVCPLDDGIDMDDAIDSMKLRANMHNFKLVADLPLSEQIEAMGEEANFMQILAFCDALIAKRMVDFNIIFAGFLPCRIAVLEDGDGQGWIVTMNMDMMLNAVDLPDDLEPLATRVRDTIYDIVDAGVNGDL